MSTQVGTWDVTGLHALNSPRWVSRRAGSGLGVDGEGNDILSSSSEAIQSLHHGFREEIRLWTEIHRNATEIKGIFN